MSPQEVQQFFQRYEAAFNALDGDAVADLWHVPSGIAHERDGQSALTWWPEDAPHVRQPPGLKVLLCTAYQEDLQAMKTAG